MRLTVSASVNGRWEIREAASFTQAAQIADHWHSLGAMPVRFKRDGVVMDDADELDRLIAEEAEADAA
ncbi:hypothetical protein [Mesorhizobium sp. BR1-1-4]|uniref:hypothetical protein n=1 Tax=Mesorhizobium sp. BR1-1-4 TaxID=2876650 RepID=UPI001CC9A261|nr:hypothetical protein [Mesorhizobium sp. BR1-1-4]MBZ9925019.1 hypothetical protein [Mesorhizobium sp. BR1-1-4]